MSARDSLAKPLGEVQSARKGRRDAKVERKVTNLSVDGVSGRNDDGVVEDALSLGLGLLLSLGSGRHLEKRQGAVTRAKGR
jgi:hypothetical protein